ncbi:MAG: hypothetical protein ACP5NP_06485 [Acetobacteraceae bacterium]
MARRSGQPRAILAFGESPNDARTLRELAAALRHDLPPVEPRQQPIILRKDIKPKIKQGMADRIAAVVRAESEVRKVVAVLAHRDLDEVEPRSDASEAHDNEAELHRTVAAAVPPECAVIAVVPAWEMEAWWFLWPEQVAKHRSGWRPLRLRVGQRVDRIRDAKEELRRALRPKHHARVPDYVESDGPRIAALVREAGTARAPRGIAIAYQRLIAALDAL